MSLTVNAVGRTDAGRVREMNEDAFHIGPRVFCVADGLGGHQAGEVASELAAETLAELDSRPVQEAVERLGETVRRANRLVHDASREDSARTGMATTVTAVVVDDSAAHLAHVGDSRCYLLRDNDVSLLTEDHTIVGRMVADGLLTAEQAAQHPQRSMVTRALGTSKHVDVDITHVPLRGGDRLLLCSDGLTAVVEPLELPRLLTVSEDLDEIADGLITVSLERGAPDNVTVVLVDISGTPSGKGRIATSDATNRKRKSGRPISRQKSGLPKRAIVWTLLIAGALIAGSMFIRNWVSGSYFVGFDENRHVAIYNGVPVEIPVFTKQELVESFENIPEDRVREFQRPELEQGVLFDSLEEAEQYVEGLRTELLDPPKVLPDPKPSGSQSPKSGNGP